MSGADCYFLYTLMVWTGITLLNSVVRMRLDVRWNYDLQEKHEVLGKTHFLHLSAVKSFSNLVRINQYSYFLFEYILISTLYLSSGYYSWRNPKKGTWFIQCLCKELQEHASTKDFLKILTRTSRRVAVDHESYNDLIPWQHQQKQVPSFNSMLIRDLYFRPKII